MVEDHVTARDGLVADFGVRRGEDFSLDLSLTIAPGTTVALLGPNGAGKSTVVAAIAGLIAIDRGSIELNGVPLDAPSMDVFVPSEHRGVGVMFQDNLLFPHMSVLDNIAFGLRSRGMSAPDANAKASTWCDRLDLTGLEHRPSGDLSGGQAQRVAMARALITDPSVLLLDEPLASLDVGTRARARKVLARHLDAFEGPRLLITHDPAEAFLLSDEIHIIEGGRITQIGSADSITRNPLSGYAADLAGTNLLRGDVMNGTVTVANQVVHVTGSPPDGPTLLTVHPRAVSLHRHQPEGSPRNSWQTTVTHIEVMADRARVSVGQPIALTSEVTTESVVALDLKVGSGVWLSIKATEIDVQRS